MKKGQSLRTGEFNVTFVAHGFYEGVFFNGKIAQFGISSRNRLNASGNSARPTKVDMEHLYDMMESNRSAWTIKYPGTPIWYKDPATTPRQKQKNEFLEKIYPDNFRDQTVEAFGGGIFGMNDPIGLGKKYSNMLKNTICVINLSGVSEKSIQYIDFDNRKIKVIIGPPKIISEKDLRIAKSGIASFILAPLAF